MFTVFEEAIINLDGKLKKETEQSASIGFLRAPAWNFCMLFWVLWSLIEPKWSWELDGIEPKWSRELDGIMQFALSQLYGDCEDCASELMRSLSLIVP